MAKVWLLLPWLLIAGDAVAGMPVYTLGEVTRLRLETVSFFALVMAGVAFAVARLWNALRRDFDRLPAVSFRGALAGVALWGLAMHLVLGMISGARELMTPGAWVRNGSMYQLAPADAREGQLRLAREQHLAALRAALWEYGKQHDGRFPIDDYWQANSRGDRSVRSSARSRTSSLIAFGMRFQPAVRAGFRSSSPSHPSASA